MIDCFDGLVISWAISTRLDPELVNTMLDTAIETVAIATTGPLSTLTAVPIIGGLGGSLGYAMQN